jgi:hypothetical protein
MKNGVFWDVTSCGSCKNLKKREAGASIDPVGTSEFMW